MKLGKIILAASLCFGVANAGDFVNYKALSGKLKKEAKANGTMATTAEVKAALASTDWAVVDVRTMEEWQAASIAGSQRVGREAPEEMLESIVVNDDGKFTKQNLIVVCNTASRASIEAKAFREMGFNTVKIYSIEAWMDECNPTVTFYSKKENKDGNKKKFGSFYPEHCVDIKK